MSHFWVGSASICLRLCSSRVLSMRRACRSPDGQCWWSPASRRPPGMTSRCRSSTSVLGSLLGDHILYGAGRRSGTRLLTLYCRLTLAPRAASKRPCGTSSASARWRYCWPGSPRASSLRGGPCRLGVHQLLAVPGPRRGRHRHLRDAVDRPRRDLRPGGAGAHRTLCATAAPAGAHRAIRRSRLPALSPPPVRPRLARSGLRR